MRGQTMKRVASFAVLQMVGFLGMPFGAQAEEGGQAVAPVAGDPYHNEPAMNLPEIMGVNQIDADLKANLQALANHLAQAGIPQPEVMEGGGQGSGGSNSYSAPAPGRGGQTITVDPRDRPLLEEELSRFLERVVQDNFNPRRRIGRKVFHRIAVNTALPQYLDAVPRIADALQNVPGEVTLDRSTISFSTGTHSVDIVFGTVGLTPTFLLVVSRDEPGGVIIYYQTFNNPNDLLAAQAEVLAIIGQDILNQLFGNGGNGNRR